MRWLTGRLALLYGALFFELGVNLPFFPVWLRAQALDDAAIGIVLAAPLLVRIIANPVATAAADRFGRTGPNPGRVRLDCHRSDRASRHCRQFPDDPCDRGPDRVCAGAADRPDGQLHLAAALDGAFGRAHLRPHPPVGIHRLRRCQYHRGLGPGRAVSRFNHRHADDFGGRYRARSRPRRRRFGKPSAQAVGSRRASPSTSR